MKKVMVADDEEDMRALLAATFESDQYELVLAEDGIQALEVARREKPDLVFLDVRMPGLDGYQVCRALKHDPATARIKVVLVTAMAQDHDRQRGRDAGADDYFTKPFSPTKLLAKLHELLAAE
ncbi:MAG: response regulator [Chloroflexi bacterium]|nr:response regulator [Chloroflexota bacterium]